MRAVPGTLHDGGAAFEATHWTMVQLAADAASTTASQQALTAFCESYWPPLYAFLRRRGHNPTDAQDLTQAFFAHLLEQKTLSRASRDKGRLRTFLLGALQNFLADEHDRATALKRGGGKQIVSINEHFADAEGAAAAELPADPAASFDRTWAATLVTQVWQRLQSDYVAEGRGEWLDALKPFVVGGSAAPAPSQEEVAARLQVPISTLRTWLQRLRERYRDCLRAEVARTVWNRSDIDEELRYLFQLLLR